MSEVGPIVKAVPAAGGIEIEDLSQDDERCSDPCLDVGLEIHLHTSFLPELSPLMAPSNQHGLAACILAIVTRDRPALHTGDSPWGTRPGVASECSDGLRVVMERWGQTTFVCARKGEPNGAEPPP